MGHEGYDNNSKFSYIYKVSNVHIDFTIK